MVFGQIGDAEHCDPFRYSAIERYARHQRRQNSSLRRPRWHPLLAVTSSRQRTACHFSASLSVSLPASHPIKHIRTEQGVLVKGVGNPFRKLKPFEPVSVS